MISDRLVEVETPEHVALGFELAGPGSRFAAFFYDVLIIAGVLLGLLLALIGLVALGMPLPTLPLMLGISFFAAFSVVWGYFVWFESAREGQTPGKKRFSLRVVHEGGYPLTIRGAAVRNLLRVIDIQPVPSCLLGGLLIMLHRRSQRIGDIAAGTIVVRERPVAALPEEAESRGAPRLSDAAYDVLREFALRRAALEPAARSRVAAKLAPHFQAYATDLRFANADQMLAELYSDESGRRVRAGSRTGSGSPAAAALLRRQRSRWAEYTTLLTHARKDRLTSFSEAEVSRFATLYREVAADLARARTYGASPDLLYTLERSVGSGHNLLYRTPPRTARRAWGWLRAGFPALVRRRWPAIGLAAALLYLPAIAWFLAVSADPEVARTVVPAEMIARAEEGAARQAEGLGYIDIPDVMMPLMSSQIIANNVQVSFIAFAGGIVAGFGTITILLLNGVFLGAVAGLFHAEGLDLYFWSFVLPHGIIELTAICVAGGAGLWLGSAIVLPGRHTRRSALVDRGREAVSLICGTIALLIIAGFIEGFISPAPLPAEAKLFFAALMVVVLLAYLALAGRDVAPDAAAGEDI